jgi:hypothetical protein
MQQIIKLEQTTFEAIKNWHHAFSSWRVRVYNSSALFATKEQALAWALEQEKPQEYTRAQVTQDERFGTD